MPGQADPPGVILLHGAGADRHAWQSVALRLQREGYMALAPDLDATPTDVSRCVSACKACLLRQGADPENLAILGADAGAAAALRYALTDGAMQAVVLVSPGLEGAQGDLEDAMARLDDRPSLLLAAKNDAYAAACARTLKAAAPVFCQMHLYPGAAHGLDLFAASPSALSQMLYWLDEVLQASADRAQ